MRGHGRATESGTDGSRKPAWWRTRAVALFALSLAAAASILLAAWQFVRLRPVEPADAPELDEWFSPQLLSDLGDEESLRPAAIASVRQLLRRFPDRAEAMDVVAILHARFGLREHAAKCWQRCLDLDPQFADAHRCLGILARDKGAYAEAVESFRRATQANGDSLPILYDLADALINREAFDEALPVVRKSLAVDPHFVPGLFLLGKIHLRRNEFQKARDVLEQAARVGPDFPLTYSALATACTRLGDTEAAQRYIKARGDLRVQESDAYRQSAKTPEARNDARQNVADILTAAARAYLFFGQPGPAEEDLRSACRAAPDHAESHRTLAWLYQEQGRTEEAIRILEEAHRAKPDQLAVGMDLGSLCISAGRLDQAESLLQKGIQLAPGRPESHAALADFYLRHRRRLPEAKALAAKAAQLGRTAPLHLLLAAACRANGDLAGAREAAQRAAAIDPGNADCQRALRSLKVETGK